MSTYFEYLFSFLKSTSTSKELLIIIGDFNLPDICWSSLSGQCPRSNLLCDFVFESNLTQLVNFPTHIKGNILDLLLTNNEDLINNLTVVKDDLCLSSDHYKICFQVNYLSFNQSAKFLMFLTTKMVTTIASVTFFLSLISANVFIRFPSQWYELVHPKSEDKI